MFPIFQLWVVQCTRDTTGHMLQSKDLVEYSWPQIHGLHKWHVKLFYFILFFKLSN